MVIVRLDKNCIYSIQNEIPSQHFSSTVPPLPEPPDYPPYIPRQLVGILVDVAAVGAVEHGVPARLLG